MNTKSYEKAVALIAVLSMFLPVVYAETSSTERDVEQTLLSGGEGKVNDKIEGKFIDFAGDDTETLVDSLRTGDALSYVVEVEQTVLDGDGNPVLIDVVNDDGTVSQVEKTELVEETVVVENSAGPLGFGGVVLAMGLAEATLPEGSEYKDIVSALLDTEHGQGILDMRADGMGWGQIYHSFDLKVGDIMSAKNSARPEKVEKANRRIKREKPVRLAKVVRPDKPERPEKPAKPERPAKPEKPEKPGRPEKPGKPDWAGRG
ncbi:MAG: hypothetical protein KJN67_01265 [Pontiella sp.]|nr:hypothetical protein [Pontiella sp.]